MRPGDEVEVPDWWVSIHARVERATIREMYNEYAVTVSIHARVERATKVVSTTSANDPVSIHARVERATRIFDRPMAG